MNIGNRDRSMITESAYDPILSRPDFRALRREIQEAYGKADWHDNPDLDADYAAELWEKHRSLSRSYTDVLNAACIEAGLPPYLEHV